MTTFPSSPEQGSASRHIRLFISFSSHDKAAVREIMSGLRDQHFDFWDYSDELESMRLSDEIRTRMRREIDSCDYFVTCVSKNSTDEASGAFTRFEVAYAVQEKRMHETGKVFIIELDDITLSDYKGPFEPLKAYLHVDYRLGQFSGHSIPAYISLLKKICQATGRNYVPQISPHPRLPFWEEFRVEVTAFCHSNHTHLFLNGVLGEFNEYFKARMFPKAYDAIVYFLVSCRYYLPEYHPVYPWIARAVTEQELGKHGEAMDSYLAALGSDPQNPVAWGGLGMCHHLGGNYPMAIECFHKAMKKSPGVQAINERLNLITSKLSARIRPDTDELQFLRSFDPEEVTDLDREELSNNGILAMSDQPGWKEDLEFRFKEQRQRILMARAFSFFCEATEGWFPDSSGKFLQLMEKAYNIYKFQVPEEEIPDAGHLTYLYLAARQLNKPRPEEILLRALQREDPRQILDKRFLKEYLAENYIAENDPWESISIFESGLIRENPTKRTQVFYAIALKNAGKNKYLEVCHKMLDPETSGLPITPEDYYWNGLANYLLGNTSRARYDYERSAGYMAWYAELFP